MKVPPKARGSSVPETVTVTAKGVLWLQLTNNPCLGIAGWANGINMVLTRKTGSHSVGVRGEGTIGPEARAVSWRKPRSQERTCALGPGKDRTQTLSNSTSSAAVPMP